MATLKKNTSYLCFVAAIMVAMATVLLSSCDARKEMDHEHRVLLLASCYSRYFPSCTDDRCRKFCGHDKPPVPSAFCNDNSNCCCPIS